MSPVPHDGHLKRLACQIAAQLPEGHEEALRVLGYVEQILVGLVGEAPTSKPSLRLVPSSSPNPEQPFLPRTR